MSLGAYYQWNPNDVVGTGPDGFGATPDSGHGYAEETAQQMLREGNVQPVGVYAQWAKQDGDVAWADLGNPRSAVLLYPGSDALVRSVETAAYGHPITWVAVLTKSAVTPSRAEAAFNGSAYGFTEAFGVYRHDDTNVIPRIQFLYWAQVRDPSDRGGGHLSLDRVAAAIGGLLVLPVQVATPAGARAHPTIPFRHAFAAQTSPGGTAAPLPGSGAGVAAMAPAPSMQPAKKSGLPWWGWAGIATGLGVVVYWAIRPSRKTAPAS